MRIPTKVLAGFIAGFFLLSGVRGEMPPPNNYTITVGIANIRNKNGNIQLQIYRDQQTFAKETPWKVYYIPKKDMKGSTLIYQLTGFSPGTYGIAVLDDENSNTKMDYGIMMPKEGFGFGDFYLGGWSRPKFDDFKFRLNGNKTVKVLLRYV